MPKYQKRYALGGPPQARMDGSGCVDHDIWAEARIASDKEAEWTVVPGRHKTFCVAADELSAALASGTLSHKTQAYKTALAGNINTMPSPMDGWGESQLESLLDANDRAQKAAAAAQEFISQVAPDGYPVRFTM